MNTKETKRQKLIETFEKELPDFAQMIKSNLAPNVGFHQDAFAADYQDEEYRLLGMAIK